jgi:hypothetical protein
MVQGMKLRRPRAVRVLVSTLTLLGGVLTVSVSAAPAFAATCTLPSGGEVHTKAWYLSQATSTKTVTVKNGTTLTGNQFIDDLSGQKAYSNDFSPAQAWFKPNGDYSYGVDFQNNGCYAVAILTTGTDTHLWVDICIAASSGQIHTRCNWNVPEGLVGFLYAGEYNASNGKIADSGNLGSHITTS